MIIMVFLELKNFLIKNLKNKNLINQPLKITLDTNIQYLINKELNKSLKLLKQLEEPLY